MASSRFGQTTTNGLRNVSCEALENSPTVDRKNTINTEIQPATDDQDVFNIDMAKSIAKQAFETGLKGLSSATAAAIRSIKLWIGSPTSTEERISEIQRTNYRLEEEKCKLLDRLASLQKTIDSKSKELERERELTQNLMDRFQQMANFKVSLPSQSEAYPRLTILFHRVNCLNSSLDQLKVRIESNCDNIDTVYDKVIKLIERQKRLDECEEVLAKMLQYMATICEDNLLKIKGECQCGKQQLTILEKMTNSRNHMNMSHKDGEIGAIDVPEDCKVYERPPQDSTALRFLSWETTEEANQILDSIVNYKFVCWLLVFMLFTLIASAKVILISQSNGEMSSNFIYRIAQLFAYYIWSFILVL